MANLRVVPGPINNDVLYLEKEHRAHYLFYNQIADISLNIRRADKKLWKIIKEHPIPENVMHYIRYAGFGGVFDCGYKTVDHGLITALVERWRPETHTFHLPIGEVTVTLQDVQVLWGLRTDGNAVTGKEPNWNYTNVYDKCVNLLGFVPDRNQFKGSQISTRYLRDVLKTPLPEDASDDACIHRARVYMLLLLSGVLFPDSTDSTVQMYLLSLIEDLHVCSQLSWGSAVLASLYRNLCKATKSNAIEICGPVMLLQLWAWCRITPTSPILPRRVNDVISGKPYGARWNCNLSFITTSPHNLLGFRSILHALNHDEFVWTPYDIVVDRLPRMCRSDTDSWLCDTYVIFWEVAEEYLPSRVMRQFHLVQTIPRARLSNVQEHRNLHHKSRRGAITRDWRVDLAAQIHRWNTRLDHTIPGEWSHNAITLDGYMSWYWTRTVIHITNPGAGVENHCRNYNLGGNFEIAVDGLSHMHQTMRQMMENDPQLQPYMQSLYDLSSQYLHLTHGEDRTNYRSTHVVDANTALPNFPTVLTQQERMPSHGARRGGRRRDQAGTSNHTNFDIEHANFSNVDFDINISLAGYPRNATTGTL